MILIDTKALVHIFICHFLGFFLFIYHGWLADEVAMYGISHLTCCETGAASLLTDDMQCLLVFDESYREFAPGGSI